MLYKIFFNNIILGFTIPIVFFFGGGRSLLKGVIRNVDSRSIEYTERRNCEVVVAISVRTLGWVAYCGYCLVVTFGSGSRSRILSQFGSGSRIMLSMLKETVRTKCHLKTFLVSWDSMLSYVWIRIQDYAINVERNYKNKMSPKDIFSQLRLYVILCVDPDPQSSWIWIQYGSGSTTLSTTRQYFFSTFANSTFRTSMVTQCHRRSQRRTEIFFLRSI